MPHPHPDSDLSAVRCGVITVSDTRSPKTDKSGKIIQSLLSEAGHEIAHYEVVRDEPDEIALLVRELAEQENIEALLLNGGTGISPRDNTYDVLERIIDKILPGFGEIFRQLSYEEIGSRAIASRAMAATYESTLIFSMPGSSGAVRLAMTELILPELRHLVKQLSGKS
ncbi:molybdenum cofactor synthesis domain protein [[Leptolyngbya] sp. PCC 7376]|uniref:MogA/MoaB family molybdenum cofactor biosynthesis protein n=1 Tax=[Leptolyngbya] sp. PCC 7376 TaxID=111781 RepID=UPI00029F08F4|nr:MogA/MoaB family molybdenum cofactor biosynthesis protein [[Leptolyngbya] sp. PCC 7376]AFY38003.1 molybdenum cofactor synthesis domain protein [[Leptolyngbya] sp. PCC 7376]